MPEDTSKARIITGILGLIGALTVGSGEFLLHFDSLARYSEDSSYLFMSNISEARLTTGHFLAVIGLSFYLLGSWHFYQMLKPAGKRGAFAAFLVTFVGFVLGGIWMSSRASIGSLIHHPDLIAQTDLISLYVTRYETLLQGIRFTTLILSVIYIVKVLSGRSRYPRWMAVFNPILLIIVSFIVYLLVPSVGKFVMPIALNIAFAIFFSLSLRFAGRQES